MVEEKIEVPKNSLWQYVAKEHLAPNISQKKWDKFVEECGDDFAERTSLIANEMFQQWSDIWKKTYRLLNSTLKLLMTEN